MGWDSWSNEHRPTDAIFRADLSQHRILESAIVDGAWYAAIQPHGRDFVTAVVYLFKRRSGVFSCKQMDETLGPAEAKCPAKILNLLSPIERLDHAGWAAQWRERCRANIAAEIAADGPSLLTPQGSTKITQIPLF